MDKKKKETKLIDRSRYFKLLSLEKSYTLEAREKIQWLGALATLANDAGSVPSTHMIAWGPDAISGL